MNILVLGSGGREHALAWKLAQSPKCQQLFIAPGNAGTQLVGTNLALDPMDFKAIGALCKEENIAMVVVGPEAPLVAGLVDYFQSETALSHILMIGPDKAAAQLEGSKRVAKEFMQKHAIPTALYQSFKKDELAQGQAFLEKMQPPYVLKADGLAAGKGVLILESLQEAKDELAAMLQGKFGAASDEVVIEEFLSGREFSVFALTDGKNYQILPVAKDYKRIGEGDTGLNTGGMGAVSPVAFADEKLMQKVEERIVKPTISGIAQAGNYYRGFVFFGLIEVKGEPYVIEYNVRLGDPETEVVLPRVKNDWVQLLKAAAQGTLGGEPLEIDENFACTVMAVSEGYPESYEKGKVISGLTQIPQLQDVISFHAGTKAQNKEVVTAGGRVIAFTGLGPTKEKALQHSYKALKTICFEGITYRTDIGHDA